MLCKNLNLLTVTDAKGQTYLRNEYSIYDRVVVQQFGDEGKFRMDYHQVASSQECTAELVENIFYRTRVRDRVGNIIDYTFNCQGNPLEVIRQTRGVRPGQPAQYTTHYQYNAQGLLTRLEQPRGNAIEYDYYANGNMLEMKRIGAENAGVLSTSYTYDPNFSRLLTVTDPQNHTTTFTPDEHGNITQKCLPEDICETYTYNNHGQILSITDGEANTDAYEYNDATGRLTRITRGAGSLNLTNQFSYDAVGNIISFTDGLQNLFSFEVNALNRVTREVSPLNIEREFDYDANNNLIHISGNAAVETTFTYNILDRVRTKEEVVGDNHTALTEYQYDLNENLIRMVDPEGNSTFIEYDERDLPWHVTKGYRTPEASTQTFAYDANGNVESLRDGNGNTVSYQYDTHDRLLKVIDPLNNEMELGYDIVGNITSMTRRGPPAQNAEKAELAKTEFIYDALGRRTSVIASISEAISQETHYAYDHAHRLTQLTDPNNHATHFAYNAADRLVEKIDALGNATRYGYDENGNLTTEVSNELPAELFTQTFEYDALNRPLRRIDNAGNVTAYQYDIRGNLTATTDAEGNVITYCYDGLNRLTEEVKGLQAPAACGGDDGIRTKYKHDDNGRVTEVTDANSHATRFSYDALNRQVGVALANGAQYAKHYDPNGNIIEEMDPNGYKITSMYDDANRRVEKSISLRNAPAGRESFTYDGLSRMVSARTVDPFGNQASVVEYAYDNLSRVLSESVNGHTVAKSYDGVGNMTERILPSGRRVAYGFDELNRLAGITDNGLPCDGILCIIGIGDPEPVALLNTTYRGRERVSLQNFGNGIQTDFGYDNLKRLVSQTTTLPLVGGGQGGGAVAAGFTYGYDKVGNRLYEQRTHDQNLAQVFEYDSLYRLTQSKAGVPDPQAELANPGSESYTAANQWTLDGVDNWLTKTQSLPFVRGGQGGVDERVQQFTPNEVNAYTSVAQDADAPVAYRYDENGNLIEDGIHTYQYNHRNLLTRVVNKADATEVASYGYDALGRRIFKTVAGIMTRYMYEGVQVIAEIAQDANGADQITKEFVYGDSIDDPIAMLTLPFVRGGQGGVDTEYHYYHSDAQGSVVALTNAEGELEERYTYDAYGEATITDATTGAVLDHSEAGNPFLYTGQMYDPETNFYYYKARYYHPALGRFLQRDPLGYVDGYNLYAYVNNNPVNLTDPLGHFKIYFPGIHEKMTIEAINKAGGEAGWFRSSFVRGVRWNDIPEGRSLFLINYFLKREGTSTYETHFGSNQHWHFMKSGNETTQQVLGKVLSQSKEWYATSMEYKHRAEENQGPNRSLFENIYANNSMGLSAFNVAHIAHIIQDFYSGGHVRRDTNDGNILEIYDYKNQNHGTHGEYDKGYSSEAVDATAKLIDLWNNNADWNEVQSFLQGLFKSKGNAKKEKK